MEQNNFYEQPNTNGQEREPLPQYDFSGQQPTYQQPMYQQPMYQQPVYQQPPQDMYTREIGECADSAFGKGLAATIMAWFPVTSIIAIILGSGSVNLVEKAQELAARCGISAGGKCVAAKILGKIGKIGGIVMTIFWGVYIFLLVSIFSAY